jgi:aspartyl-tRNA(Asn)/glutamyl-tRNA(Gln) amidotransferase subunit C
MSKTISKEDIKKISEMIRINIPENELDNYSDQLNTALDAVEVLKEIDTSKVEPTAQTHGLVNILDEDISRDGLDMKNYKNRRNFNGKYFVVKKVLN